ncbi:hypothetical protein [Pontibacter virosus]|uniref:Uncharacterized protein n=1 Tax=Pontibacter virosus TaxID=1765052 RepID=A0A2U1AI96_9BACT|nr:hypothetical protein [Pontibacter virosus]PVY36129.1 hypothetical protein C8E01_1279 [Pontibacter virosus]
MNKSIYTLVFLIFVSIGCYAQQDKEYKLASKTESGDFNYKMLSKLDSIGSEGDSAKTRQVFEPVKGNYTVYQFIAPFKGESVFGGIGNFHDILIVKVDNKNTVLDSYQYTLEWGETPLDYDLFRGIAKGVIFKDGLKIDELKLAREWDGKQEFLSDNGTIKLKN